MKQSLVSQSVIDASDAILAQLDERVEGNPDLKRIWEKNRKAARKALDREEKRKDKTVATPRKPITAKELRTNLKEMSPAEFKRYCQDAAEHQGKT
jgi:hypothetical protein